MTKGAVMARIRNALSLIIVLSSCLLPRVCSAQSGQGTYSDQDFFTDIRPTVREDSAKESSKISLIGRWEVGSCLGLTVEDDLAYFGNGSFLEVVDVSNPHLPEKLGKVLLPTSVRDVDISGTLAYVADSYFGLQIVDVSDPKIPFQVGSYSDTQRVEAITVQGKYAYLADTHEGLRIIDVSDPEHPWEVSCFDSGGFPQDVAYRDGLIYLATWDGVWIVDVTDPGYPNPVGSIEPGAYYGFESVTFHGDYAYCAAGQGGLRAFDVTNPVLPILVGSYNVMDEARDLDIFTNPDGDVFAVVATAHSGLRIIDISDPTQLVEVCNYEAGGIPAVCCHAGFAYTAAYNGGMRIIDMSDPAHPSEVAYCLAGGTGVGVVVRDEIAYVAESYSGLRIIDVSDLTTPTPLGLYRVDGRLNDVAVSGDHAYTAGSQGLRIFDVSDPMAPWQTSCTVFEGGVSDIAARDDYALCTNVDKGLVVLDVSDPSSPELFSELMVLHACQVTLGGQYAYLASEGEYATGGGLFIVDYTTPGSPDVVGYLAMNKVTDVAVCGDLAFVFGTYIAHQHGLVIVDVSDPTTPQPVGFLDIYLPITSLAAVDGYVYLAQMFNVVLLAVDVSDPTAPVVAGSYERPGYHTFCIHAENGLIFTNGVWIFRNDLLTSVGLEPVFPSLSLGQNYPNPFNPATTISYRLAASAVVRLGIYDVTGRLVCMLKDGVREGAGAYTMTWHGRNSLGHDVASGTYFYKLETDSGQATRSLVLIR